MSRYNQYGNYYDPAGSQSHQPTGYTYQPTGTPTSAFPSTSNASSYGTNYQYSGNTYGNNSASHAAAALSSLSNQNYGQSSSSTRSSSTNHYDNSNWYNQSQSSNTYGASNLALPSRTQSDHSSIYANTQSQPASTFGRLSVPEQTQRSSNTLGASSAYQSASGSTQSSYQSAYTHPQNLPPRYNSPLQAVQAQQHNHSRQSSRGSNQQQPSPQMAQTGRSAQQNASSQQSTSVEPSSMTVDPSQVYDNRAELQRKAQVEAERRRKNEAEQAAKKAEEERIEAEKKKEEAAAEEKREADEAAKKKAEQDKRNEQRRKAREEKKQSKSAATALQQMAFVGSEASAAPGTDEELEMREMFKKMREFNSKNPAMLARLWEEERKSHAQSQSPVAQSAQSSSAAPVGTPTQTTQSATPTNAAQAKSAKKSTPPKAAVSTPQTAQPVAPAQQPGAPPGQANTSLWPPHKKGTLADASAKWLRSQSQTFNSSVTAQTVLNILNTNPSYVQLCESLEAIGLKFERSALARELLRAVPDGLKAQPTAKPATPTPAPAPAPRVNESPIASPNSSKKRKPMDDSMSGSSNNLVSATGSTRPATVTYEAPLSLSGGARAVNSMESHAYPSPGIYGGRVQPTQSPYFATQTKSPSDSSRPPSQSQPPEIKPDIAPEEPPRPPADKEEAARKRTFGDLVDLTVDDSDDEPSPKRIAQPIPDPAVGVDTQHQPHAPLTKPTHLKQYVYRPNESPGAVGNYIIPSSQAPVVPGGYEYPNGIHQPPPQPPPAVQQVPPKPKGPSAEQLQQWRMKGRMLVEPIMRDRVARKSRYDPRTIARDVLLATGRHPDMRGLNAHLANMQKLLGQHGAESDSGGNRSDLSTIRWDLIDPEPSKKGNETSAVDNDESADELAEATMPEKPAPRVDRRTVDYPNTFKASDGSKVMPRRGRPPKSAYIYDGSAASNPLTNSLGEKSRPTSRPASSSSTPTAAAAASSNMPTGTPVGYAQFRQLDEDGTVIKKKGRPFGWRKNVHSREAQGLTPKTNPALPSRLKGTTAATSTNKKEKAQEQAVQQPQYQVYKCEWTRCKAELHNLDALKKHVIKLHSGKNGEEGLYECWWKGCGKPVEGGRLVARFQRIEDWVEHVDIEHLRKVGWRLGDGPKTVADITTLNSTSTELPSYLLDSRGRSITPLITPHHTTRPLTTTTNLQPTETRTMPPQPQPPNTLAPKARGRPPKDPDAKKDAPSKAERDIAAPLKKLEEQKRAVGPTMGRMGCVLVDDERRRGFLDDEDFEDVGWGSDFDPGDEG